MPNIPSKSNATTAKPNEPPRHSVLAQQIFDDIAERAHEPRRRTVDFWVVFFFAVIPIWSIVPMSWAFVGYSLYTGLAWSANWPWRTVLALSALEVIFSVYHFCLSHYISGPAPTSPATLQELQSAYARVFRAGLGYPAGASKKGYGAHESNFDQDLFTLDPMDPRAVDFRNFLRTWFGRAPWSKIRKDNVYNWLYWSIFNDAFTSMEDIPKSRRKLLDETVDLLERRAGMKFPEGFNHEVTVLRLTIDPVSTAARPFGWYVIVAIANFLVRWRLESRWQARRGTFHGLDYILRVPPNWSPNDRLRPVVFMHGLGLGLFQYALFLEKVLKSEPERPFLIPLWPHVSQEIFHPRFLRPMSRQDSATYISELLKDLGWVEKDDENEEKVKDIPNGRPNGQTNGAVKRRTGVTMLSHSNGTFSHCWILKAHPKMITRSCFVDPVVFCQWEGDLCWNFVYRPCATGIELIIKYFVSLELGVAYYIQRHFCWSSNTLWFEEIPNGHDASKTFYIVGGSDDIINGPRVRKYLESHGVTNGLYYNPKGRHGQVLLTTNKAFTEILRWLREPENP